MRRERPNTRAAIEQVIAEMKADGVPLSGTAVLQAVEEPHWEAVRGARDWRAYIPASMRKEWDALSLPIRLRVFEIAQLAALDEDAGATLATGRRSGPAE
jgi:hypothetical protein